MNTKSETLTHLRQALSTERGRLADAYEWGDLIPGWEERTGEARAEEAIVSSLQRCIAWVASQPDSEATGDADDARRLMLTVPVDACVAVPVHAPSRWATLRVRAIATPKFAPDLDAVTLTAEFEAVATDVVGLPGLAVWRRIA